MISAKELQEISAAAKDSILEEHLLSCARNGQTEAEFTPGVLEENQIQVFTDRGFAVTIDEAGIACVSWAKDE